MMTAEQHARLLEAFIANDRRQILQDRQEMRDLLGDERPKYLHTDTREQRAARLRYLIDAILTAEDSIIKHAEQLAQLSVGAPSRAVV